ncbi:MAG: aromatic amino acid lyase, partial [Gemmatirosa sp.]
EGRARHAGRELPGADALRAAGLAPVTLGHKEGLALVNGTSAMTGIAAVNAERARRAAALTARLAVLHAEVMGGHAEAWDARFGVARPHPGQVAAHAWLAAHAAGSARLAPSVQPPPRLDARMGASGLHSVDEPHQDPYTIRCVPQELGAILDVLAFHDRIVETELNAATDNPLVFAPDDDAGAPGLGSGFMGAQVTATALVAEMRTLAVPASVQTIPTNNDNQDVVTMGTIGARKAAALLDMAWQTLAIQALALAQAAELRARAERAATPDAAGFAPASLALVAAVRSVSAPLVQDRPLSDDVARVAQALEAWALLTDDTHG